MASRPNVATALTALFLLFAGQSVVPPAHAQALLPNFGNFSNITIQNISSILTAVGTFTLTQTLPANAEIEKVVIQLLQLPALTIPLELNLCRILRYNAIFVNSTTTPATCPLRSGSYLMNMTLPFHTNSTIFSQISSFIGTTFRPRVPDLVRRLLPPLTLPPLPPLPPFSPKGSPLAVLAGIPPALLNCAKALVTFESGQAQVTAPPISIIFQNSTQTC